MMIKPYYETELGKLYHGDCLEILPQLTEKVDLAITSPPYNMRTRVRNGKYTEREKSEHFSKKYKHFHDALSIEEYYIFHKKVICEVLKKAQLLFWNVSIVTGSKEAVFRLIGHFRQEIKDVIIWEKTGQPAMHPNVINRNTELILAFEQNASAGRAFNKSYFNRGKMTDIWRFPQAEFIQGHGACYPIGLSNKILIGWSRENQTILDPFLGSGTTAEACERLGRRWIGIEISKEYCDIAVKRIEQERSQIKMEF